MNQTLINLPVGYKITDYEYALDRFVNKYSHHPDVLSIYQFGEVSVPGISDLDFIVVLNDKLSIAFGDEFSINAFSEELRYIYNNTEPFLMPKSVFKDFGKVFPVSNLRLIQGIEQEVSKIDDEALHTYQAISLIDLCIYFYPSIFLEQLNSATLDVRRSLLILNSFCYPIKILSSIKNNKNDKIGQFVDFVKKIRVEWFDRDKEERIVGLRKLLADAALLSVEIIYELDNYIRTEFWSAVNSSTGVAASMFHVKFVGPYQPENILKEESAFYKREKRGISLVPISFLYPLLRYTKGDGPISNHLRRNLSAENVVFDRMSNDIDQLLDERRRIMNQHTLFYQNNRITIPMVHNYYFFEPARISGLRKLLTNILNRMSL